MSDLARRRGKLRSPLARRLIVGIVLVSSAITLSLTAVQIYGEYRYELGSIQAALRQVETVHLKSLSQSLWAANTNDLRLQLEGLVRVPNIEYVAVREGDRLWAQAGQPASSSVIERQYPMTYLHRDQPLEIGTLTVVAGLDAVYRLLLTQALIVLAGNALKTFLVAGFAFLFFHWLVNRHLLAIAAYIRGLDLRDPSPALVLARSPRAPPDELDQLAAAFNFMHENTRAAMTALRESEERLQLALDAAHMSTFDWDIPRDHITWSRGHEQLLGFAPGENGGTYASFSERVHPDDLPGINAEVARCIAAREPFAREFRAVWLDGSVHWVVGRGEFTFDNTGEAVRMRGAVIETTARRQAEEALRQSEARLRAIFETEPECVKLLDRDGNLLDMNPAGLRMIEAHSLAQVQGRSMFLLVAAEHRDAFRQLHQRVLRGEEGSLIFEVIGLKGTRRTLETRETPLRDVSGAVFAAVGITRDVTERKKAETALRESEAKFRSLAEESLAGVVVIQDGRFKYVNPALAKMTGYSKEEMLAPPTVLNFVAEEDRGLVRENLRRRVEGEIESIHFSFRAIRKDGSLADLDAFGSRTTFEGRPAVISTVLDITERKRAEQALRRGEERFRLFVEHSPAAIAMFDREMRYLAVSRRWMTDYGLGDKNIVGLSHYEIFPEIPQRWKEAHQRCLAGTVEKCEEDPFPRADGRVDWVRWEIHSWHDDGGKIGGILMFTEIVTERKRAEEKIQRLNRVYAMLSGINALIVRAQDRDELFREACRLAVEVGQFRMAWIGLVDRAAMRIRPVTWSGEEQGLLQAIEPYLSLREGTDQTHTLVARAVNEKQPVIVNDVEHDPRAALRAQLVERNFRSIAVFPLSVANEAVGALVLLAKAPGFFDEDETRLIAELAGDIAFALDHIEKAERINYLAYYDSLTGLANRDLFHDRLAQFIYTAQRERRRLAVGVVDLDRFKNVNDALGRQIGDSLLVQFAQRLARAVADSSQIARLGADRFALVLPDTENEADVSRAIESIMTQCVGKSFTLADSELRIATKVGIALYPNDGADADALFRNAEAALKKAKTAADPVLFYTRQMTERVGERLALESRLRRARENEEFALYYQPKVDANTRRVTGVEALIRWLDPQSGMILPAKFIPLLEETGIILDVGAWAIRRAIQDHAYWHANGVVAPRIAVNVSAVQLRQRDFVDMVREAVGQEAQPAPIEIEITESLLMEDIEENINRFKTINALGVNIAIDDFGTGYSSLGYLARLPVQALKIDLSFIARMLNDPGTLALVTTMISLAHSLGLTVVAEGVETEGQAAALQRLGCDELQGYLISPPLPRDQLTELLRQTPRTMPAKGKSRAARTPR